MIPEKGCTCWAKKKQRSTEMGDWNRKLEGSTLSYWKQAISSSFSSRYEGSRKLSSCVAISWPGKSWGPVVSLSYNNRWRAKPLWSLLLSSNDASPTLSVIEKNMHYSTKAKFAGIIVEYLHMCRETWFAEPTKYNATLQMKKAFARYPKIYHTRLDENAGNRLLLLTQVRVCIWQLQQVFG